MSIKCQEKKSIAIECLSWEGRPADFHTRLCKCCGFSSDTEVAKEERKEREEEKEGKEGKEGKGGEYWRIFTMVSYQRGY